MSCSASSSSLRSAVWRTAKYYTDSSPPPPLVPAAWGIARRYLLRHLYNYSFLRRSGSKNKAKAAKAKREIRRIQSRIRDKAPCLVVATDGSSMGNPGPAGAGFLLHDHEEGYGGQGVAAQRSLSLGHATSYFAELSALDPDAALDAVAGRLPNRKVPITPELSEVMPISPSGVLGLSLIHI